MLITDDPIENIDVTRGVQRVWCADVEVNRT